MPGLQRRGSVASGSPWCATPHCCSAICRARSRVCAWSCPHHCLPVPPRMPPTPPPPTLRRESFIIRVAPTRPGSCSHRCPPPRSQSGCPPSVRREAPRGVPPARQSAGPDPVVGYMKVSICTCTGVRQTGHGPPVGTRGAHPAQTHRWRQGRRRTHFGISRHRAHSEVSSSWVMSIWSASARLRCAFDSCLTLWIWCSAPLPPPSPAPSPAVGPRSIISLVMTVLRSSLDTSTTATRRRARRCSFSARRPASSFLSRARADTENRANRWARPVEVVWPRHRDVLLYACSRSASTFLHDQHLHSANSHTPWPVDETVLPCPLHRLQVRGDRVDPAAAVEVVWSSLCCGKAARARGGGGGEGERAGGARDRREGGGGRAGATHSPTRGLARRRVFRRASRSPATGWRRARTQLPGTGGALPGSALLPWWAGPRPSEAVPSSSTPPFPSPSHCSPRSCAAWHPEPWCRCVRRRSAT